MSQIERFIVFPVERQLRLFRKMTVQQQEQLWVKLPRPVQDGLDENMDEEERDRFFNLSLNQETCVSGPESPETPVATSHDENDKKRKGGAVRKAFLDEEGRPRKKKKDEPLDTEPNTTRSNARYGYMTRWTTVAQANFWESMRYFLSIHMNKSLNQRKRVFRSARGK